MRTATRSSRRAGPDGAGSVDAMSTPSARTAASQRTAGVLGVSAATVAWGLVPLILKHTHMPALTFAAYRLWMGVLVYVVVFAVTRRRLPWKTLRACALGGVFFAVDVAFSFLAYQKTSVADATIIGALAPVCIMLGAARWFGEQVDRRDLVFVGTSLVGVAIVGVGSAGSPAFGAWGDVFAGASVLSWTAYWLFSKRARVEIGTLEYMASVMLVAAFLMTAFALGSGEGLGLPRGGDWGWIWLVTLVPGALGHLLVAWSHRYVEAWLGSLITQSQPVVASIAAWILLGEQLNPPIVMGGLLVLGSTAVVLFHSRRRAGDDTFPEPESIQPAG
jgi:drug/metabolite transporter (DMT)-like permease